MVMPLVFDPLSASLLVFVRTHWTAKVQRCDQTNGNWNGKNQRCNSRQSINSMSIPNRFRLHLQDSSRIASSADRLWASSRSTWACTACSPCLTCSWSPGMAANRPQISYMPHQEPVGFRRRQVAQISEERRTHAQPADEPPGITPVSEPSANVCTHHTRAHRSVHQHFMDH